MGYEIHIVRKKDWQDFDEESNISLEEWLDYIENDADLLRKEEEGIGFCVYQTHPDLEDDYYPWFDYHNGRISSKYPDNLTLTKMFSMAKSLNAMVQGDDGETYGENGEIWAS